MAEALAKVIRASTDSDEFDMAGYGQAQLKDLVQLAFAEPIQVAEMIRCTLVVGGGKKVRQKYYDAMPLDLGQALQGIGFTEDRGASAVLECQGTYKYQHDTDKDLKFIHVFPRVDTSASEADASADAAAAAEASRAANPEWSCLTLGLDQFKKTVDKKVASFQQKQTLLRLLKAKAQQVQEFEERISNRGALNAEEQKLYENAVDLQDKTAGELTASERESVLEQFAQKLQDCETQIAEANKEGKEAKAKKLEAAKEAIGKKREALQAAKPILTRVKFAKELKQLRGKLADLAKIENSRQLQTLDTLKKLREKPELEELVKNIEDANRGWFEDEEVFEKKMKSATAGAVAAPKATGGAGAAAGGFSAAKGGAKPKAAARPGAGSSNPWAALSAD